MCCTLQSTPTRVDGHTMPARHGGVESKWHNLCAPVRRFDASTKRGTLVLFDCLLVCQGAGPVRVVQTPGVPYYMCVWMRERPTPSAPGRGRGGT